MQALPRNAKTFLGFITLLGLLSVIDALYSPLPAYEAGPDWKWELGLFLALSVLAGGTKVRLMPRSSPAHIGSLSLSFALIFATLLQFGPGWAMLAAGLSTLSACFYPKRQPGPPGCLQPRPYHCLDIHCGPGLPLGQWRSSSNECVSTVHPCHGFLPILSS